MADMELGEFRLSSSELARSCLLRAASDDSDAELEILIFLYFARIKKRNITTDFRIRATNECLSNH